MARRTVIVSDLSGKEIPDGEAVTILVSYADARKGQWKVDAHASDPEVKKLTEKGEKQARRGRKPKAASTPEPAPTPA